MDHAADKHLRWRSAACADTACLEVARCGEDVLKMGFGLPEVAAAAQAEAADAL